MQEAVADLVFAVQADVMALFSALKLGAELDAAAYQPTDAAVRKLWAQCEVILDRDAEVQPRASKSQDYCCAPFAAFDT